MDKTLQQFFADHEGKITDKWNLYIEEYERIFAPYRDRAIRLLEIGVQNGGSLEIWSKYFPNAGKIIGCDIDPKCGELKFCDERISVVVGDVNENDIKQKILQKTDAFDIIIDDGSHKSSDIIRSFALYFPYLTNEGTYIVEDLHCSYWNDYEGGLHNPYSAMSFFKRLADIINYEHWRNGKSINSLLSEYESNFQINFSDMDLLNIHSIEFINSLCIIKKLPAKKNVLGKRIIAGNEEIVTNDAKTQQHSFIQNIVSVAVNDNDLDIFELIKHSKQLTKTIARLQAQIAEHENSIQSLSSQLENRDQQIQILNREIVDYTSSTSWKITRPLRRLSRLVRRK